jgi:hypothetical protein
MVLSREACLTTLVISVSIPHTGKRWSWGSESWNIGYYVRILFSFRITIQHLLRAWYCINYDQIKARLYYSFWSGFLTGSRRSAAFELFHSPLQDMYSKFPPYISEPIHPNTWHSGNASQVPFSQWSLETIYTGLFAYILAPPAGRTAAIQVIKATPSCMNIQSLEQPWTLLSISFTSNVGTIIS